MHKIDLNCDLGESFGNYKLGLDDEVIKYISSANIACGFHASDPLVMQKTVALARDNGVAVGAHPGFPDLMGFGRRNMNVTPEEAKSLIQKTDKRRASYCEYYASKKWGAVDAYDFCLNSSALGLGGTVELIQAMVAHKEHPIPSPTEIDPTQTEA